MGDYTNKSKFNKKANFSSLVFGADTPLLETELMELQDIQNEARAELIRQVVPSGFLDVNAEIYTRKQTSFDSNGLKKGQIEVYRDPNVMMVGESSLVMDGRILNLSGFNVDASSVSNKKVNFIHLPEPPTADFVSCTGKKGYREDLVFLEAWKEEVTCDDTINKYGGEESGSVPNQIMDTRVGAETSRRVQWKWRIRTYEDIHKIHSEKEYVGYIASGGKTYVGAIAQGGNDSPLSMSFNADRSATNWSNEHLRAFYDYDSRKSTGSEGKKISLEDMGLYIAGDGTQVSKDLLKTVDGYVYAIPMFRVKRRNSGGYSVDNPNGSINYEPIELTGAQDLGVLGYGKVVNWARFQDTSSFKVGDILCWTSDIITKYYFKVHAIVNSNTLAVEFMYRTENDLIKSYVTSGNWYTSAQLYIPTKRPDRLYANIIDSRDIIDLRHKVSLTGFDYDKLLLDNFNSYMRGELGNKKTVKTYHGVRKTPTDSHTIFYWSGENSSPEVGSFSEDTHPSYTDDLTHKQALTGLGAISATVGRYGVIDLGTNHNQITIDAILNMDEVTNDKCMLSVANSAKLRVDNGLYISSSGKISDYNLAKPKGFAHVRFVYDNINNKIRFYLNGKFIKETDIDLSDNPRYVALGALWHFSNPDTLSWYDTATICDLSISDVDRGDSFASLPNDFIEGYAKIVPAFRPQRQVHSEALTAQTITDIVRPSGGNPQHIEVTQQTGGQWTAGDTVKVKCVEGEVISGVIDTDTALAKIVDFTLVGGTSVFTVDDVSKLAVNDVIRCVRTDGHICSEYVISAVDESAKKVTINTTNFNDGWVNADIIEVTASTSVPLVRNIKQNGNIDGVDSQWGTWSGLGTREATFTLSDNWDDVVNIELNYSLNMPVGQGQIEVLENVLEGEANGQRLIEGDTAVIDDFAGKVTANTIANPNVCKLKLSNTLVDPTDGTLTEADQIAYDKLEALDGNTLMTTTNINGQMAQQLFSFDLIRIVEDKYGEIPALNKVQWLKDHVSVIRAYWNGYGSCPSGNKATFRRRVSSGWYGNYESLASEVSRSSIPETASISLDSQGCWHFVAYTDPSDGTTPSTLYTDYVELEVIFKEKDNYIMLVPQNLRRDAGKSNILLVRPEIKAVETYFKADNNDGIVLIGEYTPPAELAPTEYVTILAEGDRLLASDLATSACDNQGSHHFMNPLYRVKNDQPLTLGEFGFAGVSYAGDSKNINTGAEVMINDEGFVSYFTGQYGLSVMKRPMVVIAKHLVLHEGELKLLIASKYTEDGIVSTYSKCVALLVPIKGRPLTLEPKGIRRSTKASKDWRTPDGEVYGYLNDQGEVVTTYQ